MPDLFDVSEAGSLFFWQFLMPDLFDPDDDRLVELFDDKGQGAQVISLALVGFRV